MKRSIEWVIASRIPNRRRLALLGKISLGVAVLIAAKRLIHDLGWDVLGLSPLFLALVLSTVFLLLFVLSGVLDDYKESEKIPGKIASCLDSLHMELALIHDQLPGKNLEHTQASVVHLGQALIDWLLDRIPAEQLRQDYQRCQKLVYTSSLALATPSLLQARLMQHLEVLLSLINRVEVIQNTTFVISVYWMAYLSTALVCLGLIFTRVTSAIESVFFMVVVSFVLLFLLHLIGDLDQPFGFSNEDSTEDVSLDALLLCLKRLKGANLAELESRQS
jgi:hypothetical protein